MLETILVATDGSRCADGAVELAGYLAARSGAKLIVLHVHPHEASEDLLRMAQAEHLMEPVAATMSGPVAAPSTPVSALGPGGWPTHRTRVPRDAVEAIGRQLLSQARDIATIKGVKEVRTVSKDGDPARAILDCAAQEKADMIVMGRRGLSDLQGLLMGSVSHKVSHLADCACLTVK